MIKNVHTTDFHKKLLLCKTATNSHLFHEKSFYRLFTKLSEDNLFYMFNSVAIFIAATYIFDSQHPICNDQKHCQLLH